jgi:hypothetical protein
MHVLVLNSQRKEDGKMSARYATSDDQVGMVLY